MKKILSIIAAASIGLCGFSIQASAQTPTPVQAIQTPALNGYWIIYNDGEVGVHGMAYEGTGSIPSHLNAPIVGGAANRFYGDGSYWLVGSDGGVFAFGAANFYGSAANLKLNKPIVGMTSMPDGSGYWLVASDGGVFTYGNAKFYGSMGGHHLNAPITAIAATPDGKGYYLLGADGGIFTFGDARFEGSGVSPVNWQYSNADNILVSPDNQGYVISDTGGVVSTYGSYGDTHYDYNTIAPVIGIIEEPSSPYLNYALVDGNGQLYGEHGVVFAN